MQTKETFLPCNGRHITNTQNLSAICAALQVSFSSPELSGPSIDLRIGWGQDPQPISLMTLADRSRCPPAGELEPSSRNIGTRRRYISHRTCSAHKRTETQIRFICNMPHSNSEQSRPGILRNSAATLLPFPRSCREKSENLKPCVHQFPVQ